MTEVSEQVQPQQVLATILATELVAPRHFWFSLHAPAIASSAQAGQFLHVLARESQSFDPLLRRAFSIMAAKPETGEVQILFRAAGKGTSLMAEKRVGDALDVLGPLGRPFDLSVFHVKQPFGLIPMLVGGGVGVPPLIFLGQTLKAAGFEPQMLLGARGANEVLGTRQLQQLEIKTQIATDDGSLGHAGRVTDLLEVGLISALQNSLQAVVYACGPLPMLRSVAEMAARFGARCQVSMEENMPCGIGVCNGCVVAVKKAEPIGNSDYERYQRVCVSGPALWADEVDWEAA